MASEQTVEKLVQVSLGKKLLPKAFVSMLAKLEKKAPISDNELVSALLTVPSDRLKLKLQYQFAIAFANEGVDNTRRLLSALSTLDVQSQREFVLLMKKEYATLKEPVLRYFVNEGFAQYTIQFQSSLYLLIDDEKRNLWFHILFLWGTLIDNSGRSIEQERFRSFAMEAMGQLQRLNATDKLAYFEKKSRNLLDTINVAHCLHPGAAAVEFKREKVSPTPVKKAFALNQHSKKYLKLNRLKNFLWLNERFKLWNIDGLMELYIAFFNVDVAKHDECVKQLIEILFSGISKAVKLQESPYVLFNWKNFIVSRFPAFIKESRPKNNNEANSNLESVIVKTVVGFSDAYITEMFIGGRSSHPFDLRKVFLRSCMYEDLVTVSNYTKTFPEDSESITWSHITHEKNVLNHTDHLKSEFNSKLLNINTEFTSLAESKFINFLEELASTDIQFLPTKQEQLCSLVMSSLEKFIRDKSNEKLVRLVLGLLLCLPITNYIFFTDPRGPWSIIDQLISYTDNDSFGADADESNFQETISYFGILTTGVIAMTKFFGIDLVSVTLGSSYTIEFISNFYHRLCSKFTPRVEPATNNDTDMMNRYNDLLSEWANALFDVNNDGLSDDLIRSVDVKQIYKLVFIIFQSGITANIAGSLASPNLSNGIDYLAQDFLTASSAELIHWIISNIGPLQRNSDMFLQILWKIIQSNFGENKEEGLETNYTFRLVLNLVGKELLEAVYAFRNWENKEIMLKLVRVVKQTVDEEYNRVDRPMLIQHERHTDGDSMVSTIRNALQTFLNEDESTLEQSVWKTIHNMWKVTESEEILSVLLSEISLCHGSKAGTSAEDSKLIVNFMAFLIILTSESAVDMSDAELKSTFNEIKPRGKSSMQFGTSFLLNIKDHYSSILGDSLKDSNGMSEPAEIKEPKDDLMMDFEMDDLFNDKGDDLFGDTSEQVSSRPDSPPAKVGDMYNEIISSTSVLRRILNQLLQDLETHKHDAEILKIVLAQQMEQFLLMRRVKST